MNDNQSCSVCGRRYAGEEDFLVDTRRWRICSSGHLWFNCSCGSTLMIKKGKFDWYAPERFMGDEAKSVFNKLGGLKGLPPIPSTVMQLQQLLEKPRITPRDISQELRREPVLAATVLQTAERMRSTRNASNPPIKALEHAVVYIGVKSLADILLSAALHSFSLPKSDFREKDFWEHSYLTGAIAETLMHRHKLPLNPDEVYLAGTLCNVGKLVTAFCFTPLVTKISRDVHSPTVLSTWRAAEKAYNFPEHSILGEIAASLWGFPDVIMHAIRRHHDAPDAKKKAALDVYEIVATANQLAHLVRLEPHRVEETVLRGYRERTMTSEDGLASLTKELMRIQQTLQAV